MVTKGESTKGILPRHLLEFAEKEEIDGLRMGGFFCTIGYE